MRAVKTIQTGWIYAVAALMFAAAIISAAGLAETMGAFANLNARYTARVSFLMFVVIAVSGPASRIWRGSFWQVVARKRRHLGLAFAALMAGHLAALSFNLLLFNPRPFWQAMLGAPIYVLIGLMALTSNQAAQRRMGKWWKRLHWIGVTAVLLAFTESYSSRLFREEYFVTGMVFAPIAFAAVLIRIADIVRQRRA